MLRTSFWIKDVILPLCTAELGCVYDFGWYFARLGCEAGCRPTCQMECEADPGQNCATTLGDRQVVFWGFKESQ